MQVQVQTDDHIQGGESLIQWAQQETTSRLARFRDHVTRVEVFFSDLNSGRSSPGDKRCVIEARPAGRQPVAVHADAGEVAQAFTAAIDKLIRLLGDEQGRARGHHSRDTIRTIDHKAPGQ